MTKEDRYDGHTTTRKRIVITFVLTEDSVLVIGQHHRHVNFQESSDYETINNVESVDELLSIDDQKNTK
ncbi:hypothetical protein [Haladaptatus sp. DYF46]|uniref:hypothetical protein n=1 Tax=Haladaptatus sp. DYF46 TaxID=2886041 RepID=UPI001E46F29B|nr:hypothetical protein [Haladaptatus sp. DYF46]